MKTTQAKEPLFSAIEEADDGIAPNYEYGSFDRDSLFEIFNENAKYFRSTMAGIGLRINDFLTNPQTIRLHLAGVKNLASFPLLPLPVRQPIESADFTQTLNARRSVPQFGPAMVPAQLASLLGSALATNASVMPEFAKDQTMYRKPYPSGGGLYPVEFYVLPLKVEGITPCVAHYNTISGELRVVRPTIELEEVNRVLTTPFTEEKCPAVMVFMTGVFQRSTNKYGNKGYKLALIEAGAAGQTLHLVATALGLNGLIWSSFYDDEAERLLQVDGVTESVIMAFLAG